MVLLALTAFSPKPAFAAPDTGPKVCNEVSQEFSRAVVSEVDYQIVENGKMIITRVTFTNGRHVVPEQSDHPVAMSKKDVKKYLDPMTSMTVNNSALAAVVEPERRTCASNVMKGTYNDLDPSKTAAVLPLVGDAQHSRHMVWVLKRPAWTMPRYLRC